MRSKIASWIGFLLVIAIFFAVPIANQGNKSKITVEKCDNDLTTFLRRVKRVQTSLRSVCKDVDGLFFSLPIRNLSPT